MFYTFLYYFFFQLKIYICKNFNIISWNLSNHFSYLIKIKKEVNFIFKYILTHLFIIKYIENYISVTI